MKIKLSDIEINVARKIGKEKSKKLMVVAYKETEEKIFIVSSNKNNQYIDELQFVYGKKVEIQNVGRDTIMGIIDAIYLGESKDVGRDIVENSIGKKASDIHFEPNKDSVFVRMRIDGILKLYNLLTHEEYIKLLSKMKINSNLDITEKRKPQDGKISFDFQGKVFDLRVSIINTVYGEKLVIRILYGNAFNQNLEMLNLTEFQREKLSKIMKVKTGLVIFNGPTGSGKSTTLYTIIQKLNSEEINIMTLEDPVEVIIKGVNQISLNRTIKMDFATGLKSILRQDPDVIMVGEIRDDETAKIASRAGITGHKVYSTIHTKDPREVYFRLEEMGVEEYLFRDSLVGIISQRLIRVLCNKCKVVKGINKIDGKDVITYDKNGCDCCSHTGYEGRELVAAIHSIDKNLKAKLVNINKDTSLLTNDEMVHNLKMLIINGEITQEDFNNFVEVEELEHCCEKI